MTDKKMDMLEAMKASAKTVPATKDGKNAQKAVEKLNTTGFQPIFKLDDEGDQLFGLVVDYLAERGLIEQVDIITVTMLAKSLALYIAIARQVHGMEDVIQRFDNGTSNVSGAFTALSKAQDQVLKLSAKLGLSPMDRTRILGAVANAGAANNRAQEGDAIDGLL